MTRFLLGLAVGALTTLGLFILEEYLENAALREEGSYESGPVSFNALLDQVNAHIEEGTEYDGSQWTWTAA